MNTFVLHGPHDLRDETRPEPKPGAADVLIDIRRAGICGSDVHYYEHFQIGQFIPQAPLILGHEFAGVVTEVGSTVTTVELGDRVTVEPSIECGNCSPRSASSSNRDAAGVGHVTGESGDVERADCLRVVSLRPRVSDGACNDEFRPGGRW
jgi:threonine dehydrogenase-like Zn-dependent dehydrogenase